MHKKPQLYRSSVVSVSVALPLPGCQKSNLSGVIGVIGVISVIGVIGVITSQIARFYSHTGTIQWFHKHTLKSTVKMSNVRSIKCEDV